MDRARVLCPSISVAAHAAGTTMLALAPLLVPAIPPEPNRVLFVPPYPETPLSVSFGGSPLRSAARVSRPAPREPRLAVPDVVAPLVPEELIDLGSGPWIPGLPDADAGGEPGACLFDCGAGSPRLPAVSGGVAPPLGGPPRIRISGGVRPPLKMRHVAPVYPPLAVRARVEGSVTLECLIGEDGRVSEIAVVRGHPLLDPAAVEAVRQWRYVPTLLNGVTVSVVLTVVVDFRLR